MVEIYNETLRWDLFHSFDQGTNNNALQKSCGRITQLVKPEHVKSVSISVVSFTKLLFCLVFVLIFRNLLGDNTNEKLDIKMCPDGSGQLYVPGLTEFAVESVEDINKVTDNRGRMYQSFKKWHKLIYLQIKYLDNSLINFDSIWLWDMNKETSEDTNLHLNPAGVWSGSHEPGNSLYQPEWTQLSLTRSSHHHCGWCQHLDWTAHYR